MIKSPTLSPAKSRRSRLPLLAADRPNGKGRSRTGAGSVRAAEIAAIHARIERYEMELAELMRAAAQCREVLKDLEMR